MTFSKAYFHGPLKRNAISFQIQFEGVYTVMMDRHTSKLNVRKILKLFLPETAGVVKEISALQI